MFKYSSVKKVPQSEMRARSLWHPHFHPLAPRQVISIITTDVTNKRASLTHVTASSLTLRQPCDKTSSKYSTDTRKNAQL